jgi:hypothetical protein
MAKNKTPMKSISKIHMLAAAGLSTLLFTTTAQAQKEFRMLYVCKSNVNEPGFPNLSMTDRQIDAARVAFTQTLPAMVLSLTGNRVRLRNTFIVMPRVVTSTDRSLSGGQLDPYVFSNSMPGADLREYFGTFARGYYDQVQTYNIVSGGGNANAPGFVTDSSVIWGSLSIRDESEFVTNGDGCGASWHEWLHGWQWYYSQLNTFHSNGSSSDRAVNIDDAPSYGYNRDSGGLPNWIAFLRDVTVRAAAGGTVGFGPGAWSTSSFGTPRSRFTDTAPPITNNAFYRIENRQSSRPLNVSGGGTANGAPLVQWVYSTGGSFNEQFKLVATTGGFYTLRPRSSAGSAIEVANKDQGTAVVQWALNGGLNQQWKPVYTQSGHFYLLNRSSNRRMNVNGGSVAAGATIIQWSLNSVAGAIPDNEQFRLIKL